MSHCSAVIREAKVEIEADETARKEGIRELGRCENAFNPANLMIGINYQSIVERFACKCDSIIEPF
jgi:hypothetical protein